MQIEPGAIVALDITSCTEEVAALFHRAYRLEADLIGVIKFPPLYRMAPELLAADTTFYGMRNGASIAGVVEVEQNDRVLDIHSLAVEPALLRQGIASKLLDFVLTTLDWTDVTVQTAQLNLPAIRLYEGFGFHIIEEHTIIEQKTTPEQITIVKLALRHPGEKI
jgi:ribosomal protein S18 acetylase RimI-like enzyme